MTEEMNAIQHLLEVEADASQLVDEAQKKADVIISEARAQAESEFKSSYAEFAEKLGRLSCLVLKSVITLDSIDKKRVKTFWDDYYNHNLNN